MQSDEENYRAIKEGNQIAFEMIFKTYYKPLCHYAHSFLNDKNEAEEVVQTTFIKIWEKKNELSVQSSLKAYLYSMVRNGCLNVIKHEKVKQLHAKWHVQETERSRDLVEEKVLSNEWSASTSSFGELPYATMPFPHCIFVTLWPGTRRGCSTLKRR